MILLIILGVIAATVLLLGTATATVIIAAHSEKGVTAKAGIPPFFYITLYPTYEDVFGKKNFIEGAEDEALAAHVAKILNTYLPKEATQKPKTSSTRELVDIGTLVGKLFVKTVDRWSFSVKRCHITVATGDAAETAYLYGGVSAGVSYLIALADKFTQKPIRLKNLRISADFEAKETKFDVRLEARVNISKLLLQYIRIATSKAKKQKPSKLRAFIRRKDNP